MSFSDELNLMASDCLEILGTRSITIRTRVPATFVPGTGKRPDAETNTVVTAIRGPDQPRWLGQSMRMTRVYQVAVAGFEALNMQSAMVIDGTEELDVIEYPLSADGRFLNVLCGKTK